MSYRLLVTAVLAFAASGLLIGQYSNGDIHEFKGSIDDFQKFRSDEPVTIGSWTYQVNTVARIMTVEHDHYPFSYSPLDSMDVTVMGVEISIRNNSQEPKRLPRFTVITGQLVSTAQDIGPVNGGPAPESSTKTWRWLEYDQFTKGYIDRQLHSLVVLRPGESLRGVAAFYCCLGGYEDHVFLRVWDDYRGSKSALIRFK